MGIKKHYKNCHHQNDHLRQNDDTRCRCICTCPEEAPKKECCKEGCHGDTCPVHSHPVQKEVTTEQLEKAIRHMKEHPEIYPINRANLPPLTVQSKGESSDWELDFDALLKVFLLQQLAYEKTSSVVIQGIAEDRYKNLFAFMRSLLSTAKQEERERIKAVVEEMKKPLPNLVDYLHYPKRAPEELKWRTKFNKDISDIISKLEE